MTDGKHDHDEHPGSVMAELARLRDELNLKIHLASMDARDRWEQLRPQLQELERKLEGPTAAVAESLRAAAVTLREGLRGLRDDLEREGELS